MGHYVTNAWLGLWSVGSRVFHCGISLLSFFCPATSTDGIYNISKLIIATDDC